MLPAPVPNAANTRPDIKNIPSKSGRDKLPIIPPKKKRITKITAKSMMFSGMLL